MKSLYFNEEHQTFRNTVREFVENEITPLSRFMILKKIITKTKHMRFESQSL